MISLASVAVEQPASESPSADLLLYLGEFEDASGDFVDPMSLTDPSAAVAIDPAETAPERADEKHDEV